MRTTSFNRRGHPHNKKNYAMRCACRLKTIFNFDLRKQTKFFLWELSRIVRLSRTSRSKRRDNPAKTYKTKAFLNISSILPSIASCPIPASFETSALTLPINDLSILFLSNRLSSTIKKILSKPRPKVKGADSTSILSVSTDSFASFGISFFCFQF